MVKKPKSPPSGGEGKLTGGSHVSEGFPSERELIVIAKTDVGLRAKPATEERVASFVGADVTPLSELLRSEDITLQPLFGLSEERMLDRTTSLAAETLAKRSRPFRLLPY